MEQLKSPDLSPNVSPDLLAQFLELPLGNIMSLPATMITPTEIDDWLKSHTGGPIEVYPLHKDEEDGSTSTTIWIADGNHRYFDQLREAQMKSFERNEPFIRENVLMRVRKIIPDQEHDIRSRWKTTDWHL